MDRQLHVLRTAPLTDDELVHLSDGGERCERCARLDAGVEALTYVQANQEALSWADAPGRLHAEQALVPALDAQLREAEEQQVRAEALVNAAAACLNVATSAFHEADGERRVAAKEHQATQDRFEQLGVPDPQELAVTTAAAAEVARLEAELRSHDARYAEQLTAKGRQQAQLQEADTELREADEKLASERREAEPAVKRWDEVRERALQHGLVGSLLTGGPSELAEVRGQVNLAQEAKTREAILLDRLKSAQGGPTLLAELTVLRAPTPGRFADPYLELWLAVRDWLRRRLPAQVSEVDDPQEALLRLRDQLGGLEERLDRQESELRGASEDVARGIDVQVRKARGQVTRLNKNLDGVSFGSIAASASASTRWRRWSRCCERCATALHRRSSSKRSCPSRTRWTRYFGASAAGGRGASACSSSASTSICRWRSAARRAATGKQQTQRGYRPVRPLV